MHQTSPVFDILHHLVMFTQIPRISYYNIFIFMFSPDKSDFNREGLTVLRHSMHPVKNAIAFFKRFIQEGYSFFIGTLPVGLILRRTKFKKFVYVFLLVIKSEQLYGCSIAVYCVEIFVHDLSADWGCVKHQHCAFIRFFNLSN
jgi:hypothetical protein